jgi:hypothetical protein
MLEFGFYVDSQNQINSFGGMDVEDKATSVVFSDYSSYLNKFEAKVIASDREKALEIYRQALVLKISSGIAELNKLLKIVNKKLDN